MRLLTRGPAVIRKAVRYEASTPISRQVEVEFGTVMRRASGPRCPLLIYRQKLHFPNVYNTCSIISSPETMQIISFMSKSDRSCGVTVP